MTTNLIKFENKKTKTDTCSTLLYYYITYNLQFPAGLTSEYLEL